MFKWRAGVEVAVSAKLLRHLVKTWSRLKHGFQMRISNLNSTDLFARKWLRAPATKYDEALRFRP
jgi:hypothetical protein